MNKVKDSFNNISIRDYGIIIAFIFICIALTLLTQGVFISKDNIVNVLRQISLEIIIAVGMTMVIISGGIDLSVGSVVALAGVLSCQVLKVFAGYSLLLGFSMSILAGVIVGAMAGGFNGLMITRFRIPPFISTLAVMVMARGLAYIVCDGLPIFNLPVEFNALGRGYLFEGLIGRLIPLPVLIMVLIVFLGHIFMTRTTTGTYIYAIGGNEEAARLSGISVKKIKFIVYVIIGALSAVSGIILASRLGSGDPKSGLGWELNVIAAVVIGGTSLMGGRGSISWDTDANSDGVYDCLERMIDSNGDCQPDSWYIPMSVIPPTTDCP